MKVADPLTTGDLYDLSRALVQTLTSARECRVRMDKLIDAVHIRQSTPTPNTPTPNTPGRAERE